MPGSCTLFTYPLHAPLARLRVMLFTHTTSTTSAPFFFVKFFLRNNDSCPLSSCSSMCSSPSGSALRSMIVPVTVLHGSSTCKRSGSYTCSHLEESQSAFNAGCRSTALFLVSELFKKPICFLCGGASVPIHA